MAVQNLQVTTETLLDVVVQMPEKDFEKDFEKAKKLRSDSSRISWTKDELKIIKKIEECKYTPEKEKHFANLVRKRQSETISESEFKELSKLTNEGEERTLKRLKLLVKLATLKNKSLDEIMKILKIRSPETL